MKFFTWGPPRLMGGPLHCTLGGRARAADAGAGVACIRSMLRWIQWVCLPACVGVEVEPSPASLAHSKPPSLRPPQTDGGSDAAHTCSISVDIIVFVSTL